MNTRRRRRKARTFTKLYTQISGDAMPSAKHSIDRFGVSIAIINHRYAAPPHGCRYGFLKFSSFLGNLVLAACI